MRRRPGGRLHRAGQDIASRRVQAIERKYRAAGWTDDDLRWHSGHWPDGRQHWHTDAPRAPVALYRYRLSLHDDPDDAAAVRRGELPWHQARPLPSRSQQAAAAADRLRAAQAAERAARAAAAAGKIRPARRDAIVAELRARMRWAAQPRPRPRHRAPESRNDQEARDDDPPRL